MLESMEEASQAQGPGAAGASVHRPPAHPPRFKVVLAFAAVYTIWGSTYLAIKVAIETLPPFFMASFRFLVAGTLLYALTTLGGARRPARSHWAAAFVVGALLLVGGNGALVWSEQRVPSGLAALLLATIPIWMVVLDSLRKGGPKLGARVLAGLAMGLAGLGLLIGPAELWGSSRVDPLGAGVLMFGALSWSVGSLYSRHAKLPPSPFLAAAMEMLAGGVLLLAVGFLSGEGKQLRLAAVSVHSLLGVAYLVFFGSLLGFTAYMWLLGRVPTARVSTYAYVNPVVAVFIGWAVAGEPLTVRTLLATGAIVAAVALIITHRPRPVAIAPDTEGLPTSEEEEQLGIAAEAGSDSGPPAD
jgi:drug/metabolite transporter (DMT)-like permease